MVSDAVQAPLPLSGTLWLKDVAGCLERQKEEGEKNVLNRNQPGFHWEAAGDQSGSRRHSEAEIAADIYDQEVTTTRF